MILSSLLCLLVEHERAILWLLASGGALRLLCYRGLPMLVIASRLRRQIILGLTAGFFRCYCVLPLLLGCLSRLTMLYRSARRLFRTRSRSATCVTRGE